MSRKSPHLAYRHLKYYGSVLGARPESFALDDLFEDQPPTRSKLEKAWRKRRRRDAPAPAPESRADDRNVAG